MVDEAVQTLVAMGFSESQSRDALTECSGDLDRAVNFLLNPVNSGGIITAGTSTDTAIVQSEISQYIDPSIGRSACTPIALILASFVLKELHDKSTNNVQAVISTTFLSNALMQGLQVYTELQSKNSSGVEHFSVEEIIQVDAGLQQFSSLKMLPDSPRQGVLSSSSDNPMGLQSILSACQHDGSGQSYLAVVITKPPETILVLLPSTATSTTHQKYVLLDSHPRPNNFAPHYPSGSYALFHSDMQSLVKSLEEIFPAVDLGSDVNELMAMMYNSFDVYPFELKV